jgi:hypothetical protein
MRGSDDRRVGRSSRRCALARARLDAALTHFGSRAYLWLTLEDLLREDPMDAIPADRESMRSPETMSH